MYYKSTKLLRSLYFNELEQIKSSQHSSGTEPIIPIIDSNMVDNSWIYTAVTRAEIEIELVGNELCQGFL